MTPAINPGGIATQNYNTTTSVGALRGASDPAESGAFPGIWLTKLVRPGKRGPPHGIDDRAAPGLREHPCPYVNLTDDRARTGVESQDKKKPTAIPLSNRKSWG